MRIFIVERKSLSKSEVFFIVTSHGWSASNWFAVALDTHPEILCFHSAMHKHARGDSLSEEYLKENALEHGDAVNSRENLSIDVAFDRIKMRAQDPRKRVFGNVHTYRIRDLPALQDKYPTPREHMLMNLIRHPVSLVNSGFGQLRIFIEWDINTLIDVAGLQEMRFELDDIIKRYNLNLTDPNVVTFMSACQHLFFLARDQIIAPDAPTIIMERLTADREYYCEIVRNLTSGEIECTDEYLDEVFSLGKRNKHAQNSTIDPAQQFLKWEDWQRDTFLIALRKSGIKDLYAKYDYDFSFI